MLVLQIVQGTPVRIWILLAALVALGLSQARARTMGAARALGLPAAMVALSFAGVVSTFGTGALAIAAWAAGIVATFAAANATLPRIAATWTPTRDRVHVGGSWLPLALILGLFATKYAAGASLAMHPDLATHASFASGFGLAYGAFSGLFAQRGWQLWQARGATAAAFA